MRKAITSRVLTGEILPPKRKTGTLARLAGEKGISTQP
jgi:hypothetical protein